MKQGWFSKWLENFFNKHGERLVFMALTTIFASAMYYFIPATRDQVIAVYFIVIGLLVNKSRSPKEELEKPVV